MNFLAHLALSGNNPEVMVGNFIGDFVKGKTHERYAPLIQKGILLHRTIDSFTDRHLATKHCSLLVKDGYGRYSGVIVDIFFDHFLAANWSTLHPKISLKEFVSMVHRIMIRHYFQLPGEVKGFLPFLINSRRLENYQHLWGIERALEIMTRHTSLPLQVPYAMAQLENHYAEFQENFFRLYNDLLDYISAHLLMVNEPARL